MSCMVGGDLLGDTRYQSSTKVLCLFQGIRRIGNFTLFLSVGGGQYRPVPGLSLNIIAEPTPQTATPSVGPAAGGTFVSFSTAETIPDMPMECEFGELGARTGAIRISDQQFGCFSAAKASSARVRVFLWLGTTRSKSNVFFQYLERERAMLEAVLPSVGSIQGGLWVDIVGKHFDIQRPGCRYGARESLILWASSSLIRCKTLPSTPGPVFWQVKGTDGQHVSALRAFYVLQTPEIDSIQPSWAVQGNSSAVVTLRGRHFEMSLYVQINGLGWQVCDILSTAMGTCRLVLSLEPQLVTLRVSNNKRESGMKCSSPFQILGEPRINKLIPSSGPVKGGMQLTVVGEHLGDQADVMLVTCVFEDIGMSQARVLSSTRVICVTPAHDIPSIVQVHVTCGEDGLVVSGSMNVQYTLQCTVQSTAQHVESETGLHVIRVVGENFMPDAVSCSIGQDNRLLQAVWLTSTVSLCKARGDIPRAQSFTFYCDNQLIDARILDDDWSEVLLLSLSPTVGRGGDGAWIELRGVFRTDMNDARCVFGQGKTYAEARWLSTSRVQCGIPALASGNVTVSLSVGSNDIISNSLLFISLDQIKIQRLLPSRGLVGVYTFVSVVGSLDHMGLHSTCRFGSMHSSAVMISSSMAACKISSSFARRVELKLCISEQDQVCSNVLRFDFEEAFAVLKITPSSGPTRGGTKITLIGNQLGRNTTFCKFGQSSVGRATITIAASLAVCESPSMQAGLVPLTIVQSEYTFAALNSNEFAYLYWPEPQVTSIVPSIAYQEISTVITMKGQGLAPLLEAGCGIGGAVAKLSRESSGDYVCRVPQGLAVGLYRITFNIHGLEPLSSDLQLAVEPSTNILEIRPTCGPARGGTTISIRIRGALSEKDLGCMIGAQWTGLIKGSRHDEFRCVAPPSTVIGEVAMRLASRESVKYDTAASRHSGKEWTFKFYDDEQVDAVLPGEVFLSPDLHLTVIGRNFEQSHDISCLFADKHVKMATLITSTQVLCDIPSLEEGKMSLKVANNGVDFSLSSQTVRLEPQIEALLITPSKGPMVGGITLTVFHSRLILARNVSFKFRDQVAQGQSLPGKFVCVVPTGSSPGNVSVLVMSDAKEKVMDFMFQYEELGIVKLVYPTIGPTDGGSLVTFAISKLHVKDALVCSFEGEMVDAKLGKSREEVVCYTPSHQEGTVRLELYKGSLALSGPGIEFMFAPLFVVEEIFPSSGPTQGNSIATIVGRNFLSGKDLYCLFSTSATLSTVVDSRKIVCRTPESPAGTISMSVGLDSQVFSRGYLLYEFYTQVQLDAIIPEVCLAETPSRITMLGANFDEKVLCDVGAISAVAMELVDVSRAVLEIPGLPAGEHSIRCSKVGGHLSNVRTLHSWAFPLDIVIDPTSSAVGGGTVISVLASTAFPTTTWRCLFGKSPVDAQIVDHKTLQCTAPPAHEAGSVEMMITSTGRNSFKSPRFPFLYIPTDAVHMLDYHPSEGPCSGGTVIHFSTSHGMETVGSVRCVFGATTVEGYSDANTSRLVCVSPPGRPGLMQLRVISVVKGMVEWDLLYSYMPNPILSTVWPSLFVVEGQATARVTLSGENFMDRESLRCMFGRKEGIPYFHTSTHLECAIEGLQHGNFSMYVRSDNGLSAESVQVIVTKPVKVVKAQCRQRARGLERSFIRLVGSGFSYDKVVRCELDSLYVQAVFVSEDVMLCHFDSLRCRKVFNLSIEVTEGDNIFKIVAQPEIFEEQGGARIHSCVPSQGSLGGGTIVTVRGKNLVGGQSACRFGRLRTDSLAQVSSTMVLCVSPKQLVSSDVEVVVLGDDGLYSDAGVTYLYRPVARIHGVFPSSVRRGLSTPITVQGADFEMESMLCRQDRRKVVDSRIVSSSLIVCTITPTSSEAVNVSVSANRLEWSNDFSVAVVDQHQRNPNSLVRISGLSPSFGQYGGGTQVQIFGSGFSAVTQIRFGQAQAQCFYLTTSFTLCNTPPSKSPGLVNVFIVSDVPSRNGSSTWFEYIAEAQVLHAYPSSGTSDGGTTVTVVGRGFERGYQPICKFGERTVEGTFQSSTQAVCTSPVHVAGNVSLSLSVNGADYTRTVCNYQYVSGVTIVSIQPSAGSVNGGDSITVQGTGFFSGLSCKFDSSSSSDTSFKSSFMIICVSPFFERSFLAELSLWSSGQRYTSGQQISFQYLSVPRIYSVNPSSLTTSGISSVTVVGVDLLEGDFCIFSHEPSSSMPGALLNGQLLCKVAMPRILSSETAFIEVARKANADLRSNKIPIVLRQSIEISALIPKVFESGDTSILTIIGEGFSANPPMCLQIASLQYVVEAPSSSMLLCELTTQEIGIGSHVIALCPDSGYDLKSANASIEIVSRVVLERVTPSVGPRMGSTAVTIWGNSFHEETEYFCKVRDGVAQAMVMNSTTIMCTIPEIQDGDGLVHICVHTKRLSNDTRKSTDCVQYLLMPPHRLEGIVPSLIKKSKGKSIFVSGEGFVGINQYTCLFGSDIRTSAQYLTSRVLRCPIIDRLEGKYLISIYYGALSAALNGFLAEFGGRDQVTRVSPSHGHASSKNTVTVHGWGFSGFDTLFCRISHTFTYPARQISDKEIVCDIAAPSLHGVVGLDVTWRGLSLVNEPLTFEFLTREVTIFRVVPSICHRAGTALTVFGLNFRDLDHLYIQVSDAKYEATILSSSMAATQIRSFPIGMHYVSVGNMQGNQPTEHSNQLPFARVHPPRLYEVVPSTGPVTGDTLITLIGENLGHSYRNTYIWVFGKHETTCSAQTTTTLLCNTPPSKSPGLVNVFIVSDVPSRNGSSTWFEYIAEAQVLHAYPSSGTSDGGTTVTVVGRGFERGYQPICKFGERTVEGTFQSSTQAVCTSPVHVAGNVSLSLSVNGADYTRTVCNYQYVSGVTIVSIQPSAGSVNVIHCFFNHQ
ncbi:hypothetical protein GUITHDRAFT_113438 [Guillardia theta CCMP2712]|uniref:IPT/TIG domain-containing protein n=1 Tax=Guillardia theta (strain CCMP2712) TaxID=905079 RepID=L1IX05_GUITC|nr:hypothetical protein GUITHDRAFT_113438 [Guillardia theta CCMP2712]EKX40409.1 hypothetical protein GUITHDRAFT_113438 [Guillardia theta CCMP2712]|eukprot:XP_005827389.1 hypothetical protein GUITHDRAFT_113438 [Guillardia theta CCMP2712]